MIACRRCCAPHDPAVAGMMRAHKAHEQTLREARRALRALGAHATFRRRSARGSAASFDLVITIGGDGTLLWASQMIGADRPVLGDQQRARGQRRLLLRGQPRRHRRCARDALAGRLAQTQLTRMRVAIDGGLATSRVLNDVLFSHHSPAATTRYRIRLRGRDEEQQVERRMGLDRGRFDRGDPFGRRPRAADRVGAAAVRGARAVSARAQAVSPAQGA